MLVFKRYGFLFVSIRLPAQVGIIRIIFVSYMYNPEDKKDNIDKIKESLYSKNTDAIFSKKVHVLENKSGAEVSSNWNIEEDKPESSFKIPYTKILMGSFIFFILALGFTFSKFFFGQNIVSGDNIDILLSGPVSIAGGEELPLNVEIKNNNNSVLKSVNLRVEYPDGTKSSADQTIDLPRYSESIGEIAVNKSEKRLLKSIIYGEENSEKTITITVEYRVTGSNAVFSKKKDFNILISSSPVNILVSGPTEINANQLTNFNIDINSNSTTIVKNLILKVEYPFGFNLSSSDPKASGSDNSVFTIGDLAPGAKRSIRITGSVMGQDGEQRVFKFIVGTKEDDSNSVKTALASYLSSVSLKKSSIGLDVSINDNSENNISVNTGSKNRVDIAWSNNLADKVYDMSIKVKFVGQTLDKGSVTADKGFYNSLDNSIVFDSSSNSSFSEVNPESEGNISFTFGTLTPSSNSSVDFKNSSIKLEISVLGKLTSSNSSEKETLYSDTKTVKLSSNLKLLSRGFRTIGAFENSGPFPPKADNESTYTITWTATNSFNEIASAKVSAFLSPNVKWTGYTNPDTENIVYDKNTGEIVWDIGSLRAGVGTSYPSRSVSFQVSITPSITQVGSEINLINEATISGVDSSSNERVGEVKSAVTTNITSDPEYIDGMGKVIK